MQYMVDPSPSPPCPSTQRGGGWGGILPVLCCGADGVAIDLASSALGSGAPPPPVRLASKRFENRSADVGPARCATGVRVDAGAGQACTPPPYASPLVYTA